MEDGFDEFGEGIGCEAVRLGDALQLAGFFGGFEGFVAFEDLLFGAALAEVELADVFFEEIPLVGKLGIGGDEGDELLAGHLLLAG